MILLLFSFCDDIIGTLVSFMFELNMLNKTASKIQALFVSTKKLFSWGMQIPVKDRYGTFRELCSRLSFVLQPTLYNYHGLQIYSCPNRILTPTITPLLSTGSDAYEDQG